MPFLRLLLSATLLALLASCATTTTTTTAKRKATKPLTYEGRVLTGATEYYYPGRPSPSAIARTTAPAKPKPFSFLARNKDAGSRKDPYAQTGHRSLFTAGGGAAGGSTYSGPPVFANPDGTTSRVVGNTLIRSDGTHGDMIGNTVFYPNGTTARITGNVIHNPNGTISRKIN